jgi:hypothetical protein
LTTLMAIDYPATPLLPGHTADVTVRPGRSYLLTALDANHWETDVRNGVQSEVLRGSDGYTVVTTNGRASLTSVFATWREAMIHGLV